MDNVVLKIRELSLRKWMLISIGLTVLAMLCLMGANNSNGYMASLFVGQCSTLVLMASFVAFAVSDVSKAKTLMIVIAIGVASALIGIFLAFSGFMGGWLDFCNSFQRISMEELAEYNIVYSNTFLLIENAAMAGALFMGLSSINKRYMAPWVLLICFFVLSFFNLMFFRMETFGFGDYQRFNSVIGVLSFIALIWILMVGGEKDDMKPTESKVEKAAPSSSDTILSKTETLLKLKELLDSGVLTPEEFEVEKNKILN